MSAKTITHKATNNGLVNIKTQKTIPYRTKSGNTNKRILSIMKNGKIKATEYKKVAKKAKLTQDQIASTITNKSLQSLKASHLNLLNLTNNTNITQTEAFQKNKSTVYDEKTKKFYNKKWFDSKEDLKEQILVDNVIKKDKTINEAEV